MRHVGVEDHSVANCAVPRQHSLYCRLGGGVVCNGRIEEQTIGSMASGAGVMHFIVANAQWDTGGDASGGRMAARTGQ